MAKATFEPELLMTDGIATLIETPAPVSGGADFQPVPGGFRYASELLEFIHSRWDFCSPAACYPETHTEAPDPETDLRNLVRKVEAGAVPIVDAELPNAPNESMNYMVRWSPPVGRSIRSR